MSRESRERRKRNKGLPNYLPALLDSARRALDAGAVRRGVAYAVEVRHDAWCDLVAGRGLCNCNPEVGPPRPMARGGG